MSYITDVNSKFQEIYGCTIEDLGLEEQELHEAEFRKESPEDYVKWFGEKYDLTPKSEYTFDMAVTIFRHDIKK